MHTLVLHTSGDEPLLRGLGHGLLKQRLQLRQRRIGLRFPGFSSPQHQWRLLAGAMANQQKHAWLEAMRWRRFIPRDTWLCSYVFHNCLLRERNLSDWRDWLESQQLNLIVVVHLLPPRERSWMQFVRQIMELSATAQPSQQDHSVFLCNDFYNTLIETTGVRGSRFVLHTQSCEAREETSWPGLLVSGDGLAGPLERPHWPRQGRLGSQDLRPFALSLALTQYLSQPLLAKERERLLQAVKTSAAKLQHVSLAEAQALATQAGWLAPDGPELHENLELFARRVWGSTWPWEVHEPGEAIPADGDLSRHQTVLDAVARELLERTSS